MARIEEEYEKDEDRLKKLRWIPPKLCDFLMSNMWVGEMSAKRRPSEREPVTCVILKWYPPRQVFFRHAKHDPVCACSD